MLDRRSFLMLAAAASMATPLSLRGESNTLPPWAPGVLEIHHIDTGRGNATLILYPDGTTLLIDAGEAHSALRTMPPASPDASRPAGEWVARYVRRHIGRIHRSELDLMLLTHLHGDHVGEVAATSPASSRGDYRVTGAAFVAEALPVRDCIDRGWPDYSYPAALKDPNSINYTRLAKSMAEHGTRVQRAIAGSASQCGLRQEPSRYPDFNARILAVNGDVWQGNGEASRSFFPAVTGMPAADLPTENMCSIAVRLQYGGFRYYTGGDLSDDTIYGRLPWHDIESPVAAACGPVSMAVANHHGYYDAEGPAAVRALRPRAWIIPGWHVTHPALSTLATLLSPELYPGDRSLFALGMTPESLLVNERLAPKLSSTTGHIVVRVPPGGRHFTVFLVNPKDETDTVTASFGPFPS